MADTEFGRVSITTSTSADGKQWLSLWSATTDAVREDLYGCFQRRGRPRKTSCVHMSGA